MPGTTTPEPNTLPRLCVTQTTLPSRSAIENEVVWPSPGRPSAAASIARSGRSTGLPSRTRARAGLRRGRRTAVRRASAATARRWRCARRRRGGSRAAPCRHARRRCAPSCRGRSLRGCAASAGTGSLAGRRRHMDRAAAIGRRQRIDPLRLDGREIVHGEAAAQLGQARDDLLAERAAVEQARAFGAERLQRAGEVGLLQRDASPASPRRCRRCRSRDHSG